MLFDPLAQTIAAYDQISARYSNQWFKSDAVTDLVDRFTRLLDENPVILDAGCGSGREINSLTNLGLDCIGVDLSYETVKLARNNCPSGYFRVMDVRELDFPDDLFDGIICIAVLHHLFDRDFRKTLAQFRRVTKSGGIIALTIRLGDGHFADEFGRFSILRNEELIKSELNTSGFLVVESVLSESHEGRRWLQLLLRNAPKRSFNNESLCPFCKGKMFLRENRSANAPIAASVLWGDDQFFVTLDVSPLIEGHLLLVTNDHVLSTLGTQQDLARIASHKSQIEHVLKRALKRKPVFLEHGSVHQDRDPCIEHAHIHALPLKREIREPIQKQLGNLVKYQSIFRADAAVSGLEYLSYENKRGQIFISSENVSHQPSQFMRKVVSAEIGKDEFRWLPCRDDEETRTAYKSSLQKIFDVLDAEVLSREIVSDIPQEVRGRLGGIDGYPGNRKMLSRTGRGIISRLALDYKGKLVEKLALDDVGEYDIVQKILVPYFDSGYRGATYIGDDAAVFPWRSNQLLATSDHCPRPVFFSLGIESYESYGWLSVIISLSDIAAMGGVPKALLLNTEMPPEMNVVDYLSFIEGVAFASKTYGTRVIGGNIRESSNFSASTMVFGDLEKGVEFRRDGADPGECIFVVGEMGLFWAAVLARYHNLLLPLENHSELTAGLLFPEPKLSAAQLLAATGIVGACMDASDGPTEAIYSLARASGCDLFVEVDGMVPNQSVALVAKYLDIDPISLMFTWGNFELVFTAREASLYKSIGSNLEAYKIRKIGYVRAGSGRAFAVSAGRKVPLPRSSTEQFAKSRKPSIKQYEDAVRSTVYFGQ